MGDNIAVGEKREPLVDLDDGSGATGSIEKKLVTKVYSAVALSMRTSNKDRRSASVGSFYQSYLTSAPRFSQNNKATYIRFVVG